MTSLYKYSNLRLSSELCSALMEATRIFGSHVVKSSHKFCLSGSEFYLLNSSLNGPMTVHALLLVYDIFPHGLIPL